MKLGPLTKLALPLAATALTGGGAGALQLLGGQDPLPAVDIAAALRDRTPTSASGEPPCTVPLP